MADGYPTFSWMPIKMYIKLYVMVPDEQSVISYSINVHSNLKVMNFINIIHMRKCTRGSSMSMWELGYVIWAKM